MRRFVTTLDELLADPPRHTLLLFSGGLDGSYLLLRLAERGARVTALNVRIGAPPDPAAAETAGRFGAAYLEVDATSRFYADFLPAAIHADAYYQGQFPVGSTLTRPLMAQVAVEKAAELDCDAVGHTATYLQNTTARLGRAVTVLGPALHVVCPLLGTYVPRTEKIAALGAAGHEYTPGIHSVDANPWSRVIENGSLDSPENRLDERVFTLVRDTADSPAGGVELTLGFRHGLPHSLDGRELGLRQLVERLNVVAASQGVGRFSGLEDTPFGFKNHEVRESPAAAVITAGHRALGNAVYGTQEHLVRSGLAEQWTTIAVQGGWFSPLGRALAGCLGELDQPLTGVVRLRLARGNVTVLQLHAAEGLYHARFGEELHAWMGAYEYGAWHHLQAVIDHAPRERGTGPEETS